MKLKLVLKGPDRLMGAQIERTLEDGSLVIGRSPSADWTLPDPERVVSKAHCRVDKDFSGFVLTDTSTNGVKINDDPVGFGLPRLLSDGDVLTLGDAVILVRVDKDETPKPPPEKPAYPPPAAAAANIPDGPFGVSGKTVQPKQPDVFAAVGAGAGIQPPGQILDDWWAPVAPQVAGSDPISVDISPKEVPSAIRNTITAQDPLPSLGGDVTKLAGSLAGVDLAAFAQAVDAAAAVLPESERLRFHERLRDLLDGSRFQGK